ncbi:Spy0128 family protein, partial [Enterococcus sp.]|uniref:Spy0128 family protein n=1 Tax=Enterococcus sp. TaxID=35783 RepID=UPI00290BBD60
MRQKIWGLFSIILIVSNMLPIGVFAETITQKGAVIQEALLKHSDGTEITNENPLSSGESIDVEMTWLISGEEALPAALPSNLIFEDQEGSMKDSKGTYVVKNNQLIFSKTDEEGPVVATVTLKASTTGKDLVNERVDFGNSVTKMIFYLPEEEDSDEPASQRSITPQEIKEIKPTVTNVLLEKSNGSGGWSPIEEGETQLTTKGFRLSVNWEIPDSSAIQAGDYMEIKLPSILRLTDVPASALNIKVEGQDYHVGTYELYTVTDASGKYDYSVFRVDFNDTIEREKITTIENGYFRYTGLFNKELTEEEIVTIGDFELPSFNIGKNPDREINFTENLYKQGYQSTNTNRLQWSVHVNMDDVTSIYKGGKASSETYSNAVFVDELDEGLTFLRQQVGSEAAPFPYRALVPIYKVLADGTVTDSRIGSVLMAHKDYHDVTTSINLTSIDRAKEDIKKHPTGSFAIYTDDVTKKETLLIHLGKITDTALGAEAGLVFDQTWEYMENMINRATSMTDEEKVATLASLKNLYDESNGTWSIGYTIEMQAEADSSISSDHKFSNTAHLYYDNGDMTSNESSVVYQKSDAGGEGKVPKNAIEIVKRDKDTDQPIADVEFEVVSFDNDQEGVQVGTLTTDPNGKATLGNLKVGKYKIKEVSGLDNYDPKMIIENQTNLTTDGVFEISASDTAGFSFEIYNQRLTGSVDIKVKKILNGSALKAGDFEFTLTGHGENQTQTNAENGAVAFDNIKYDTPGIYTYTIEETKGNAEGITYDPKKVTATVTVKKGQGELETSVVYTDDDEDNSNTPEEFINTYVKPKPKPTELALEAKKTLEGKDLSADDFEFKLTGHGEDQT